MQKITIKNFGPIQDTTLEIRDFTLLIGPQASGKSTIGKAIFFFKMLRDELYQYIVESADNNKLRQPENSFTKIVKTRYLDFWGPTFHLRNIFLHYEYQKDVWIKITLEHWNKFIEVEFSQAFKEALNSIFKHTEDYILYRSLKKNTGLTSADLIDLTSQRSSFLGTIQTMIYDLFDERKELMFIPAGRSLLATLSDQIQYVNPRKLDYLMREFVNRINRTKSYFNKSLQKLLTERKHLTQEPINYDAVKLAESIIEKILRGSYRYDREGEKIYLDNNKYVKLNFSSSGQQESIWILLLLFLFILENQGVFLVIEEPEAHLYPEAQKDISQLISLVAHLNGSQVIITTHSPYVLATFNNLILAEKVGSKYPDIVKEKIPPLLWLSFSGVNACKTGEGKVVSILDDALCLVRSEEIDTASQIINEEFDFLFQYEN